MFTLSNHQQHFQKFLNTLFIQQSEIIPSEISIHFPPKLNFQILKLLIN